jgi:hypothetical protein
MLASLRGKQAHSDALLLGSSTPSPRTIRWQIVGEDQVGAPLP